MPYDKHAYQRADDYHLTRLESVIRTTYDEDTRRAYVQNWIDRATRLANGSRTDAGEWKKKLDCNRRRWLGLYEETCGICKEPFTPTKPGQALRQAQDRLLCPACIKGRAEGVGGRAEEPRRPRSGVGTGIALT